MSCSVLAIDPGTVESAIVEWDGDKVLYHAKWRNSHILTLLHWRARNQGGWEMPDVKQPSLFLEMIASYGLPVGREVFETCVWTGRFQQKWEEDKGLTYRILRKDIKKHLKATNDAQVRARLIERFGAPGTKRTPGRLYGVVGDQWAALALAVYAYDRGL